MINLIDVIVFFAISFLFLILGIARKKSSPLILWGSGFVFALALNLLLLYLDK